MTVQNLRLYLDENVSVFWVAGLEKLDCDVLTARDAGRLGLTDEEQLEFATRENRVLLAHDGDFRLVHTYWFRKNREHGGILLTSFYKEKYPQIFFDNFQFTLDGIPQERIRNNVLWIVVPKS